MGKMTETALVRLIMMALSRAGVTVWRNNQGRAWAGHPVIRPSVPSNVRVNPGDVVIRNAFPLKVGLTTGAGDLIGFTPVRVTQEMVGAVVAKFTSIEVKTQAGRATADQKHFCDFVAAKGGVAAIVRSEDDAVKAVSNG